MSRQIDVRTAYEDLTDDERYYLDCRQWLKEQHYTAHQQWLADGSPDSPEGSSEDPDESDLTPEQWVAQANRKQIMAELDERGVEYGKTESKDSLGAKLLASSAT